MLGVKKALSFDVENQKKSRGSIDNNNNNNKNYEIWLLKENYINLFKKLNTMYKDIQITLSCRQIETQD